MNEALPGDEFEESRAALAPTLEATAAVLPWLAKPRALRFEEKLNKRWIAAASRLAIAWSERHEQGGAEVRPAIFGLYSIALETADNDCLLLGETLASAADLLESGEPPARLVAALTASIECLVEEGGLEHVLFAERARHFAQRLSDSMNSALDNNPRSAVLDRLFASEATERLERMHDALTALPPDAYALKLENSELALHAEHLDLYGVVHLARQLENLILGGDKAGDLDNPTQRRAIEVILHQIEVAIATLDA